MKNQFDWGESAKKGDEFFGLQGWQKGGANLSQKIVRGNRALRMQAWHVQLRMHTSACP